jgi:L-ascorbate metabolism protein UlaG (beta-lactamase superfamily)
MLTALVLVGVVMTAIMLISFMISAPRYNGPRLPHFDGRRFINPAGVKAKGFPDVVKWMLSRKSVPWKPNPMATPGAKPAGLVNDGIQITFVNHSTFLIQVDGLNILTDPVWSERTSPFSFAGPKRMRPPGIRFDDLPKIDVVLLSHNHYDHLDSRTVTALQDTFHPMFIEPLGVGRFLEEFGIASFIDLDWWTGTEVAKKIYVEAVPAQHFSGRGLFDRDATLWCGYVIKTSHGNIYFAGDTGYNPSTFKEIGERFPPRVSIIPIGAYRPEWFMAPIHCSPAGAVQIHKDVKSPLSIASHFGTFPLADDGDNEAVTELKAALQASGIPPGDFQALAEGSSIRVV